MATSDVDEEVFTALPIPPPFSKPSTMPIAKAINAPVSTTDLNCHR
jgi:hypothetical protein